MTPKTEPNPIVRAWDDRGAPHPFATFASGWNAAEKQMAAGEKDPTIRPVGMTLDERLGDYRVALVAPGMPAGADVFAGPVAQEPVAWLIDWPDEPDLGHYIAESPADIDSGRSRALVFADAAPVAAQAQPEPLHITHGPLMREAAALLRLRKPVTPDFARVASELEAALDGRPTPAGEPQQEWLDVAASAEDHIRDATKMVAGCCGRSECGGECGNDWVGMVPAQQPVSGADGLPPFAEKIIENLARVYENFCDSQDTDIGRHWLDMLTQLGLLNRIQKSPARWEITEQGEDVLRGRAAQPQPSGNAGDLPTDAEFDGWAEDLAKMGYEANREGVEAYLRKIFSDRAALAAQAGGQDRVDAERYRYLRDHPWPEDLKSVVTLQQNARWDAIIDAARKAKEQQ